MVTMLDVARCAGVSKSTVSRVLNGKDVVREEVKALVYKAIEETGYRPNLLAQQLATKKSSMIGLVMTNAVYNGPFFSTLVYNAAKFCEAHNHRLIFADGKQSAEEEMNAIDFLVRMKCAGVMVYARHIPAPQLAKIISESPVPIMALNQRLSALPDNAVFIDHYRGSEIMMDYLQAQGHRRIAYIRGNMLSPSNTARQQAWQDKLNALGVKDTDALLAQGDWSMESGYRAAQALFAQGRTFSAILAANDDMALGAIKALKDQGLAVPEDVSVAGFDNAKVGRFVSPALTTLDIPIEHMIQNAVERILSIKNDPARAALCGTLVVRESVGQRCSSED
ncbi:LacI family DNA-binding transcriptional regulator [Mixta calida]|uniref:LacI family DNA-binding transcriptional regulator n=1 Tax=Mixta calida TaxID=665913 RepID=UPI000EB82FC9|nr:LacI family DNA-binding transcriptional regulator [Mixta calida]MDU4289896.1 LacI family DNA-binding transcriptional regulator [Mixta calida]HCW45940.1 transcriptional regulator [Erwiniaceae bacterium]